LSNRLSNPFVVKFLDNQNNVINSQEFKQEREKESGLMSIYSYQPSHWSSSIGLLQKRKGKTFIHNEFTFLLVAQMPMDILQKVNKVSIEFVQR